MAIITGSGTLNGTRSADTITGLATDDSLFGDAGNDTLDGGAGDDLLRGGRGSDIYVFALGSGDDTIDNSGGSKSDLDTIQLSGLNPGDIRLTRVGNDLVLTLLGSGETLTVNQYFLDDDHKIDRIQFANGTFWDGSAILANLTQTATEGADVINGTPGDDILQGLGGNDTLYGDAGNDTLDGGSGADRMEGGTGDDRYIVDNAGDLVVEASNAGIDTVESGISYTLAANVENLVLTGTANLNGTGNSLANTLTGNAGNNLLDGGSGNDSMAGGLGDDTYVVAQNGDTVIEAASEGTDTVRAAISYTLGANLENLDLTGTGNIAGTGNTLDNRLTGNSGRNTLDGGAGNDWLKGSTGSDTYRYGLNYGHDLIDNSGGGNRDVDTLQLLGLNPADVRFVRSGDDLKMVVLATEQTLTVQGFYLDADHEIDQVVFGNGTTWNNATLKAAAANSANLPPSSTDDSVTTPEDTPVILGVDDFGTYSDPESSPLAAVMITALPGAGSLEYHDGSDWTAVSQGQVISRADLDAGRLRYVPAPDGNGQDYASIGFRVGDGTDFALTANTLTVDVTPIDDAPAVSGPVTLPVGSEDIAYTISAAQLLVNASDVDAGDTLSVQSVSVDAADGSLVDNGDGSWTFTPALNRNGAVSFAVVIADAAGATVATSASLSLAAVNDAPTLANPLANQTASQDQPFSYSVPANAFADVDGDALSYSASLADGSALPGWLVFDAQSRSFSGTPGNGDVGSLSVKVTASDGSLSAEANFSLTVGNSNDAPTVTGPVTLPAGSEDVAYTISATQLLANASDVDADDTLSVQSVSVDPSMGVLTGNGDDTWVFTPAANLNGQVSFQVVLADSQNAIVGTTASLLLTPVNDTPSGSATGELADGGEDTPYVIYANELLQGFSDVDGDVLSVSNLAATRGSLSDNGDGSWVFTPEENYSGSVELTYDVVDGRGGSVSDNQEFDLVAVPDSPVLSVPGWSPTANGGLVTLTFTGSLSLAQDFEGVIGIPDGTKYVATLTYALGLSDSNPHAGVGDYWNTQSGMGFMVEFESGHVFVSDPVSPNLLVEVANENNGRDNIVFISYSNVFYSSDGQVLDLEYSQIVIQLDDSTSNALSDTEIPTALDLSDWNFSWGLQLLGRSAGFGSDFFYRSTLDTVESLISGEGANVRVLEDHPAELGVVSYLVDMDGSETLEVKVQGVPAGFALSAGSMDDSGSWVLNPDDLPGLTISAPENYVGTLTLNVVAIATETSNGNSASTAHTLSLEFVAVNDAPTVSGPVTLPAGSEDVAYTISAAQLLANASDVDAGDTLSVQSVSVDPADGSLVDNGDGSWTFTPALNRNGAVSFAVVIADAAGATVATSASLSLAAVNDAPSGGVSIDGTPTAGQLLSASDTLADVDGLGVITYQWQASSDGENWSDIAGASGATFTLTAAEVGQLVRVQARYTDGGGNAEAVASAATGAVAPQFNLIEGGSGNDPLTGTALADRILGYAGDDTLHGLDGDDELEGGAGDDDLLGGAGNDAALFAGNLDQYVLNFDPRGYLTVQAGAGSGEAGLDRLQLIEQLGFADATLTVTGSLGGELRVNSSSQDNQYSPAITGLSDGGYVVSWMSANQDGSGWGIYAQRYAADGNVQGSEVRVNSTTVNSQELPTITGLSDGGYVVSWQSLSQDGSGWGIYAQRYAADGSAQGNEVRVNSTTLDDQLSPTITGLSDGGYVVSWMSANQDGSGWGIYAQRYAADGSVQGSEVRVNSTLLDSQVSPAITGLSDGDYMVTWASLNQDGSGFGIYAQRYAADGSAQGNEVRVNSTTASDQTSPTITGLSDGGYVVSWVSWSQDGSGWGIYAQRYAADGSVVGGEVRVNSTSLDDQISQTITGLSDGGYVVSWASLNQDGSGYGIYAQRYAANGSTVGGEVWVNSTSLESQDAPTITGLSDGGYVVSWMSDSQDGSGWGIYAQRFDDSGSPIANSLTLWGDEAANQVLLGAGDERVGGGGGDDVLLGGDGRDTALYLGGQHDFAFDFSSPSLLALSDQKLADGDEGNDQLQDFERLEFGDGVSLTAIIGEVRVNTTTTSDQWYPAISGLSGGGYVVSWMSPDGGGLGVYSQRYAADGSAAGSEVQLNGITLGDQSNPTISRLSDGGYVVSWQSLNQDGSGYGIFAQRYMANGSPVNGVVVNTTTTSDQLNPSIAGLSDGGYVVSWQSVNQDGSGWGIYTQRYAANGSALGGEVRVNSTTVWDQSNPTITGLSDGGYVVSWQSQSQDGSGYGIYAQRYAANGSALGGEVQVNSTTAWDQSNPTITGLGDGGYVVSWMSANQDGHWNGIYAQRYAADGSALGGEVQVNTTTASDQTNPTITSLSDGGYVVSWVSYDQDGSNSGIFAQRFAADGSALGGEVRVNSTTLDRQEQPTITGLSDGGYVVSWMSLNQDGSGWGIYAQCFDAAGNPVIDHLEWSGDATANTIRSSAEVDWFSGGAGADSFQFAQLPGERADLVTDFITGVDRLELLSSLFPMGGNGSLDAGELVNAVNASEQAGAYLVFNQSNQTLYYDADGAANGNAVAVVTLSGVASLAASDVQLYG